MLRSDDRICIVTGAAQGLGFAISRALASIGLGLVMVDVNREKLIKAASEIESANASVKAIAADLTVAGEVNAMVAEVISQFGRIDVLINAAGGSGDTPVKEIDEITDDRWQSVIDRNLNSTFFCCRAVAPIMKQNGGGRIVNFSSRTWLGSPSTTLYTTGCRLAYCASKGAIHGLTNQLAHDLRPHGVTVNIVMPGLILTEPGARVRDRFDALSDSDKAIVEHAWKSSGSGTPADVAAVILFLISPSARTITGETLGLSL